VGGALLDSAAGPPAFVFGATCARSLLVFTFVVRISGSSKQLFGELK
jgi:hypothetical protein